MPDAPQFVNAGRFEPAAGALLKRVYLPFLREAQNRDGGWGYRPGHRSGVEPTSWALRALASAERADLFEDHFRRGCDWLTGMQLPDGSWPAFGGQQRGCWVTALACLALHHLRDDSGPSVERGLFWLCNDRPGEGRLWWRFRQRLHARKSAVHQDSFLVGWSWTPGTASWVEPTSHSLILLRTIPQELHPPGAARRRELGERMLYNRVCPGGGWNSGNPLVYGVAGEPRVIPTVWALLALAEQAKRAENQQSLDWLERSYGRIQGPASLALAHLCLESYGRPTAPLGPEVARFYEINHFFADMLTTAWVAIALGPQPARAGVAGKRGS
jgi:hypothetical protein